MSRWWRAYDEAVDDAKLCLLSDAAHRGWFNLMCVASINGGTLPEMEVLRVKLRLPVKKIKNILTELIGRGLLDEVDGIVRPHNWNSRQYQSDVSTERVKQFRERQRNVSATVDETPPEKTDTDSETEAEKKTERTRASALDPRFEAFWIKYPNRVGKQAAAKAFEKAIKSVDVTTQKIMDGLDRYVAKTDDRPWCNPATWLNQGRWDDQPAATILRINSNIPRPGSREDRQEKTANALRKLEDFIGADESGSRGQAGQEAAGLLRIAKSP